MTQATAQQVGFAPRRLGHANLFVGELDRSMRFYHGVCGFEEVRREPGIGGGFLSNGNTHHDLGLIQVGEQPRVGVGGHVQIPKGRGTRPGLNHLGWEMETEAKLVEAYRRARAAGLNVHRTTDHQISHSVYVFDPEGNLNEFYADMLEDWRSIFNPSRDELISGPWDPEAAAPSTLPRYDPRPVVRRVEAAAFHPIRITHAVIAARDISVLRAFYTEVAGLCVVDEGADGALVCLRGTSSAYDLALCQSQTDLQPGLHHMGFKQANEDDLDGGVRALLSLSIRPERSVTTAGKRAVFFRDPDGLGVEMYVSRAPDDGPVRPFAGDGAGQPYLV